VIVVQNQLSQPMVMHPHGVTVPNRRTACRSSPSRRSCREDRSATRSRFGISREPTVLTRTSSTEQVGKGPPAFIVEDTGKSPWDEEYMVFTDDGPLGYGLNGKSFPAT
jgi:hypothetical protein